MSSTAAEGAWVGVGGALILAVTQQRCTDSHAPSQQKSPGHGQLGKFPELPVRLQRTGTKGCSGGGRGGVT